MKLAKRIAMILASVLTALGLIMMIAGMFMLDWDYYRLDLDGEYVEKTYTAQSVDIREIRVELNNMKVKVVPTDAERVTLHYLDNETQRVTVTEENGVLSLKDRSGSFNFDNLWKQLTSGMFHGLRKGDFTAVVEIPRSLLPSLYLHSSNAWVGVQSVGLDTAEIVTSNGRLELNEVHCQTLSAQSSNAAVVLNGVSVQGEAGIATSNGSIELHGLDAEKLDAATSNAAIQVQELTARQISLNTSNGNIGGTVLGSSAQYSVSSGTSHGNNSIAHLKEDPSLPYSLSAFTSNASIELIFQQN